MKIHIQDGEGDAQVRVCSLNRCHADDLEGECSQCRNPIFYRPEPPYLARFLCLECAAPLLRGKHEICLSSKTLAFLKTLKKT